MKHLVQYLAHNWISMHVDSRHFFSSEKSKLLLVLGLFVSCNVYPVRFSVFLLGEMGSGTNSKTDMLKKH